MKVLIAYPNMEFVKQIREQISKICEIKVARDGCEALELCRTYAPDLLVLDLEMPQMDGLSILRAVRASGLNPTIMAISVCAESAYAQRQLVQLGVQYVLPKPCTATAVVARLYEMMLMHAGTVWNDVDEVSSIMLSLGLRMNLSGFKHTCDAVLMLLDDEAKQITKCIYPELAVRCGNTAVSIERVIRSVITDAWKRRDDNVWKMYFKPDRNGQIPCPSNAYFISRISMCVQRRKIG